MVVQARDTSTEWGWKRMRVPPSQPARHSEIPSQNQNQNQSKDWRCRPVGEHLPSTCTGQGLLPSTARLPRQHTEEGQLEQQQDRQRHVAREAIHFYILQFFGSARRKHQLSLLKALAGNWVVWGQPTQHRINHPNSTELQPLDLASSSPNRSGR